MPRDIRLIVIHCSDTPDDLTLSSKSAAGIVTPAMEIDRWHRERGFQRSDIWRSRQEHNLSAIGYHYVIGRNGTVFLGRHLDEVGAHVKGYNRASIGICLVGRSSFSPEQFVTLASMLASLARIYDIQWRHPVFGSSIGAVSRTGICGHRDLPGVAKECPGFDMSAWLKTHPFPNN